MAQKISREPLDYSRHPAMAAKQDPDLLDELAYEHRLIERLWNEVQRAHRTEAGGGNAADASRLGDVTEQSELAQQLIEALAKHEAVEVDILYPAAAGVMNAEWVEHATTDHALIREMLDEAYGQHPGEERVFDLLSEAMERVVAHIQEEEKILFPSMRFEIPRGQLTHPGHPDGRELMPGHPMVIDLAAAEREASKGTGESGRSGGNGRKDKQRRRLLRR